MVPTWVPQVGRCYKWFPQSSKELENAAALMTSSNLDSTVKTLGVYLHQCCWVLGHVLLQDADAQSKVSMASTSSS